MSATLTRRFLVALLAVLPHTCRGKSALLIVDVQDCFLPGGSLGVDGADSIIPKINDLLSNASCLFDMVVRTRDFHPSGHISFGSTHGLPAFADLPPPLGLGKGELSVTCLKPESGTAADAACCPTYYLNKSSFDCSTQLCPADGSASWDYNVNMSGIVMNNTACSMCASNPSLCFETTQRMWTDHCEQTGDSTLASSLLMTGNEKLILKGTNLFVDAYSAFMDNSRNLRTVLDDELQANGVTELYIVGIASDVCVMYTVMDALHSSTGNYSVTVVSDATAGITPQTHADAISTFQATEGVTLLTTAEVVASACPETTTGAETTSTEMNGGVTTSADMSGAETTSTEMSGGGMTSTEMGDGDSDADGGFAAAPGALGAILAAFAAIQVAGP